LNEITIELRRGQSYRILWRKKQQKRCPIKEVLPKIKIVVRGNKITAFGEEELLEHFEKQVDRLVMHYGKYNALDDDAVLNILQSEEDDAFGLDPDDNKVILHGVGGKIIKPKPSTKLDWLQPCLKMIWFLLLALLVPVRLTLVWHWL
jgi:phosphate starvation-inducible PhoH-like protein